MRLRAALAKAVPQTRALSSEERALAAHQARERHLAQVAAACAEEVRRSKKVAEDMKERKAAEEKRYRLEMEERLAEADRRRAEYKKGSGGIIGRRPRTASIEVVVDGEDGKKAGVATIAEEEEDVDVDDVVVAEGVEKGDCVVDGVGVKRGYHTSLSSGRGAAAAGGASVWNEKIAATKIQRAWRFRRRRLVVSEFLRLGLSMQKVEASDFESTSAFVSEERVIHATKNVLQLLTCTDAERAKNTTATTTSTTTVVESDGVNTSVRAFLSAYLILGHPGAVFRQDGEQEQLLVSRAKELLVTFESSLSEMAVLVRDNGENVNSSSSISKNNNLVATRAYLASQASAESFSQVYGRYMTAFTAWKASDFSALVDTMVASFVELDAIWQTVKDKGGDEAAEEYREGIRSNQALILGKIKRLAGPEKANGLVLSAVRESRKGRTPPRRREQQQQQQWRRREQDNGWSGEEEDARPRAIVDAGTGEGMEAEGDGEAEVIKPVTVSDTSMGGSNTARVTKTSSGTEVTPTTDLSTAEYTQTFQLTRLFSPIPPNRVLAHELALDKSYRITLAPHLAGENTNTSTYPSPSSASALTSSSSSGSPSPSYSPSPVYAEVCAAMRHGFESGQGNLWTVAMAENIRGKLLRLLSPGSSMHSLIAETLDSEHVYRQCTKGVFSYERFFGFMADILPRLCAPVRDPEAKVLVRELRGCDGGGGSTGYLAALIDKLLRLLHFIDLLSLDYSNYMLQQATPLLLQEAPAYEQRLFAQDLESGAVTLERTRAWWKGAVDGLRAEMSPVSHQQVYVRALLDTAFGGGGAVAASAAGEIGPGGGGGLAIPIPIPGADLPETLSLDRDRLTRIRTDVVRIVSVGAILLTAKNLLKRDVRAPWRTEATRMLELLLRDGYSGLATAAATPGNGPSMPARILTVLESSHALPPATRAQLQGTIGKVLAQAAGQDSAGAGPGSDTDSVGPRITDPVMKVLVQRIRAYVAGRLGTTGDAGIISSSISGTAAPLPSIATGLGSAGAGSNVNTGGASTGSSALSHTASTPSGYAGGGGGVSSGGGNGVFVGAAATGDTTQLISSGLSEFVGPIAELAESVRRIGDVDWRAHGRWYLEMEV